MRENPPTTISLTQWGMTVTITLDHSDTNLHEIMQVVRQLLIAAGYPYDSVNEYIEPE